MKIAYVVSTFPPHIGGMGSVCQKEAQLMSAEGHDVTVFTLHYSHFTYADQSFPFKVVRFKTWPRIGNAGWMPQLILKLKDFDLVHLHYPFYGAAEWVWLSSIINHQKYIVTYHMDAQTRGLKSVIQKIYDNIWPLFIFKSACRIISVDLEHFVTSEFCRKISQNKVVELYNGVDAEVYKRHDVNFDKLGLSKIADKKIILFVGNPMPLKRLDLLMKAFVSLNDQSCALLIVGGGYELEYYKRLADDLKISHCTYFVGRCHSDQSLSDYYSIAKVAVVPSDYESFSLVVIEAMACGTPVIGTNIPGVRSKISDGEDGLLFNKGSVEDLREALRSILSLSQQQSELMGERGCKKVTEKYSWRRHGEILEKIYKEVVVA